MKKAKTIKAKEIKTKPVKAFSSAIKKASVAGAMKSAGMPKAKTSPVERTERQRMKKS